MPHSSEPATPSRPAIAPQMKPLLEAMRARMAGRPPMDAGDVAAIRRRFDEDVARWNEDPPPLPRIEDRPVAGRDGPLAARLYDPDPRAAVLPGLIYFHGGGWIVGGLDSEDRWLRLLARRAGLRVVSVAYGLAPENKFPGPVEDCLAACRFLRQRAADWGLDGDRLAVGGASAGANLALAAALALRDRGEAWLRYGVLLYGVYTCGAPSESRRLFGGGDYGPGNEAMDFFLSLYLGNEAQRQDPRVNLAAAELAGLPPLFLISAGLDPLRDETRLMCRRLAAVGVACEHVEYSGVIHGFTLMTRDLDVANQALADTAAALRRGLTAEQGLP